MQASPAQIQQKVMLAYNLYPIYIKASPAQIQQKVLQKILGKVFITMNCTQHKTLHALKVDLLEMSDNKNI